MNNKYWFLDYLSKLLNEGYSISDILILCKTLKYDKYVDNLESSLSKGMSLDDAIIELHFDKTFNEFFSFYKKTNNTSKAIKHSLKICYLKQDIINKLKKELSYPLMLIVFVVIFSFVIISFLLPQVENLFIEFQIEQSIIVKILFSVFKIVPYTIILIVTFLITNLIITITAIKKQNYKLIDFITFKIPIISTYVKKYYSIKFALYYNELLETNYDSSKIIQILYQDVDDSDIRMIIYEIRNDIIKGDSMEHIIDKFDYFEDTFRLYFKMMLNDLSDEKSLKDYIDIALNSIQTRINQLIKISIPFIYGFVATFVIMIYISIIIPMMNVVSDL